MHTAFPSLCKEFKSFMSFTREIEQLENFVDKIKWEDKIILGIVREIARLVSRNETPVKYLDQFSGEVMARAMSVLLNVGLPIIIGKKDGFFKENFEIIDPNVPDGVRYYNGRFLFRTDKPEDNMNVLLKFCPDRSELLKNGKLDADAVVSAKVMDEDEAERIQYDMDKVDFVIYFRDVKTMIRLAFEARDLDLVGMLMGNMMHVKGNVGHIFKFGAIGQNIASALQL